MGLYRCCGCWSVADHIRYPWMVSKPEGLGQGCYYGRREGAAMTVFCPYHPSLTCDDGYISGQPRERKCAAWISPDCISDVCCSGACKKSFSFCDDVYHYLPCELSRCPYTGCGRHEVVIDLPQEVLEAVVVYQVKEAEKRQAIE